jgi:hypothetical protein
VNTSGEKEYDVTSSLTSLSTKEIPIKANATGLKARKYKLKKLPPSPKFLTQTSLLPQASTASKRNYLMQNEGLCNVSDDAGKTLVKKIPKSGIKDAQCKTKLSANGKFNKDLDNLTASLDNTTCSARTEDSSTHQTCSVTPSRASNDDGVEPLDKEGISRHTRFFSTKNKSLVAFTKQSNSPNRSRNKEQSTVSLNSTSSNGRKKTVSK